MLPKFAIAGLAATAFIAATALMPTAAAAGGGRGGGQIGRSRDLELSGLH